MLHSNPSDYDSTASAHIHFKVNVDDWDEYSYVVYERVFNLIKLFQVFFKNSPHKGSKNLSSRQTDHTWCDLNKIGRSSDFISRSRYNYCLTPNDGFGTLEFRFNDVPKSLNQLNMFQYMVYLALNENIKIPDIDVEINKFDDVHKMTNSGMFSYKDKKSVETYKSCYKQSLLDFAKYVNTIVKDKFYDFYGDRYVSFYTLVKDSLNYEMDIFDKWFKSEKSDTEWSDEWKSKFCKTIKKELIK